MESSSRHGDGHRGGGGGGGGSVKWPATLGPSKNYMPTPLSAFSQRRQQQQQQQQQEDDDEARSSPDAAKKARSSAEHGLRKRKRPSKKQDSADEVKSKLPLPPCRDNKDSSTQQRSEQGMESSVRGRPVAAAHEEMRRGEDAEEACGSEEPVTYTETLSMRRASTNEKWPFLVYRSRFPVCVGLVRARADKEHQTAVKGEEKTVQKGDVVLAIDGVAVTSHEHAVKLFAEAGVVMTLEVRRMRAQTLPSAEGEQSLPPSQQPLPQRQQDSRHDSQPPPPQSSRAVWQIPARSAFFSALSPPPHADPPTAAEEPTLKKQKQEEGKTVVAAPPPPPVHTSRLGLPKPPPSLPPPPPTPTTATAVQDGREEKKECITAREDSPDNLSSSSSDSDSDSDSDGEEDQAHEEAVHLAPKRSRSSSCQTSHSRQASSSHDDDDDIGETSMTGPSNSVSPAPQPHASDPLPLPPRPVAEAVVKTTAAATAVPVEAAVRRVPSFHHPAFAAPGTALPRVWAKAQETRREATHKGSTNAGHPSPSPLPPPAPSHSSAAPPDAKKVVVALPPAANHVERQMPQVREALQMLFASPHAYGTSLPDSASFFADRRQRLFLTDALASDAETRRGLQEALNQLPNAPRRAVYDRGSCPFSHDEETERASGVNAYFHGCVQKVLTSHALSTGRGAVASPGDSDEAAEGHDDGGGGMGKRGDASWEAVLTGRVDLALAAKNALKHGKQSSTATHVGSRTTPHAGEQGSARATVEAKALALKNDAAVDPLRAAMLAKRAQFDVANAAMYAVMEAQQAARKERKEKAAEALRTCESSAQAFREQLAQAIEVYENDQQGVHGGGTQQPAKRKCSEGLLGSVR